MSEARNLFSVLRQSADPETVDAIEKLVQDAPDRALCRINVLDFAAKTGLDEERVIAAFLHAARLGIFELAWNVLCPGCGGVIDSTTTLKSVDKDEYTCAWCAAGYTPTLDEIVEVTFTVNRRVRRVAAHDPNELPFNEYFRQVFCRDRCACRWRTIPIRGCSRGCGSPTTSSTSCSPGANPF
jgi:hypothetical protein